jgi:hypothetical protein
MASKLKIDLSQGVLEVEGSESFVKTIYNDFKAHFIEEETPEEVEPVKPAKTRRTKATRVPKTTASRSKSTSKTVTPQPEPQVEAPVAEPVPEVVDTEFLIEEKPSSEIKISPMKPSYTYLKELALGAANGRPSLVEFMDAKFPITNEERNLVFIHYLQNVVGLKSITADHIYTCYKAANIRTPLNIENSLEQTASQRHWIKIDKSGHLTLTATGKNYVENQLPKKTKIGS